MFAFYWRRMTRASALLCDFIGVGSLLCVCQRGQPESKIVKERTCVIPRVNGYISTLFKVWKKTHTHQVACGLVRLLYALLLMLLLLPVNRTRHE